jgi:hypothetical protein
MANIANAKARRVRVRIMPTRSPRKLQDERNDRLRVLVRQIIDKDFDGNQAAAAKALGVSGATIHDFLAGKRGAGNRLIDGITAYTGRSSTDYWHGPTVEYEPGQRRTIPSTALGQHPQ